VAAAPGGKLVPSLAESWTVSPDGLAYAFKIRRGVKFHDGTELTAADVEFSLQRMMALKQGFSYLYDGWVSAVKASGPSTVASTTSPASGCRRRSIARWATRRASRWPPSAVRATCS